MEAYLAAMITIIASGAKSIMTIEAAILAGPLVFASIAATLPIDREWQAVWFAFVGGAFGGYCNAAYDLLMYLIHKHYGKHAAIKDKSDPPLLLLAGLRISISMPIGVAAALGYYASVNELHLFHVLCIAFAVSFSGLALKPVIYSAVMRSIKALAGSNDEKKDKQ